MNKSFLAIRTFSRCFRTSAFAQAKIVEVVPPLGESITEGSISKWMKNVGEQINVDDIVVVVETDKVTVDIKSNHAGVLTKQLCLDTVIVGKELYEVDTDGEVTSAPSKKTEKATEKVEKKAAALAADPAAKAPTTESHSETSTSDHSHGSRKPSIKFLGKRSHVKADHKDEAPSSSKPSSAKPSKPQTGVSFTTLKSGAFYGRPVLSQREIDAIETGGAMV